jgi:hypothetical protein
LLKPSARGLSESIVVGEVMFTRRRRLKALLNALEALDEARVVLARAADRLERGRG